MSLTLVGDRKGIQSQNLRTNYPSLNALSLHSSSFATVPSPVSSTWCKSIKEDIYRVRERESRGNWLTEVHLEGWPLNKRVYCLSSDFQTPDESEIENSPCCSILRLTHAEHILVCR